MVECELCNCSLRGIGGGRGERDELARSGALKDRDFQVQN